MKQVWRKFVYRNTRVDNMTDWFKKQDALYRRTR